MTKHRVDVYNTCQFIGYDALRYTCAAHHPCGTGGIFSDDVRLPVSRSGKNGDAVIRVKIYDVVILCIMLLNVGEQKSDTTVNSADS